MAKAYYGSKISKNITKTPEGFLVCKNVPIARTGVQKYLARELGINNSDDVVLVYRTEEEVFSQKTIASFEGKVFTEEHPADWVTPSNAQVYMKGAVTNVGRGKGTESDLLLADIIVYNAEQIRAIESSEKREVSCGYECEYEPYKNGYVQTSIVGNHVALVSAGRAGHRIAIRDNNIKESNIERRKNNMPGENGYKLPRRQKAKDFLYGIGLKHFAMDADPEDMAEAVDELVSEKLNEENLEEKAAPVVEEPVVEDEKPDDTFNKAALLDEIAELKDSIRELMNSADESYEEELEPSGLDALDELEEELETEDGDEGEEIESVELPAEEINESEEPEEINATTTDSIRELASVMKQVVAEIPDAKRRKRTADALAKVLKKHADDAKKGADVYASMAKRAKDAKMTEDDSNIGLEIAKKFNKHYQDK